MFRRHHLSASLRSVRFASVVLVTGLVAASANGCSDPEQATPRVAFDSSVFPGKHPATGCGKTGTWFTIGNFGNPALGRMNPADPESPLIDPVVPIDDGAADQQGTVSISCSVAEDGDGFQVKAHAELTGATGGAVTISGRFTKDGDQPDITVALTTHGETFTDAHCTASFDKTLGHAVAAGRVWAQVVCPNAEYQSAQQICESKAQFRFENCAQ
ncbi:MAG: hypothetical protein JWP87_2969 [Labilithrix sp.]|nr:hypothetical protein [Labilithrix sp.]